MARWHEHFRQFGFPRYSKLVADVVDLAIEHARTSR